MVGLAKKKPTIPDLTSEVRPAYSPASVHSHTGAYLPISFLSALASGEVDCTVETTGETNEFGSQLCFQLNITGLAGPPRANVR